MQEWGREDAVAGLFEGRISSLTRCTQVDFQSEKEESFYDLQLQASALWGRARALRCRARERSGRMCSGGERERAVGV